MKYCTLFGLRFISCNSFEAVAENILDRRALIPEGKFPLVITPNVDQIVKMNRKENLALSKRLRDANWILPDGQPVVLFSKFIYGKQGLPKRLTGSDLFPIIWREIQKRQLKAYFVLPSDDLGNRLEAEYPNIGYYSPPFFSLGNEEQYVEVKTRIQDDLARVRPDVVFLGLGFPKQEYLAMAAIDNLPSLPARNPVFLLLGASFEFYFGTKKRAPMIYQRMGIEFVHRIISEPRRMVKRYLYDDLAIIPIAIKEWRKGVRELGE